MPTCNVVLTDRQADMIEQLVTSGRYQDASQVLREGLGLLEQRQAQEANRLQALRSALKLGLDDMHAGRIKTFDDKDTLRKHLQLLTYILIATARALFGRLLPTVPCCRGQELLVCAGTSPIWGVIDTR
jgi:antitoxin ParD1/3/4